jgi:hypothetical protein
MMPQKGAISRYIARITFLNVPQQTLLALLLPIIALPAASAIRLGEA